MAPVRSQEQYGSCWAFSTTSSLEGGDWFITNDNLSHSSERQLMGGDTVDPACDGRLVDDGFAFAEKSGPCTEASYSCITTKFSCKDSSCTADIVQGSVTGYRDGSTVGERALMLAVARQPVSTTIATDQPLFQSHSPGVLTASCSRASFDVDRDVVYCQCGPQPASWVRGEVSAKTPQTPLS